MTFNLTLKKSLVILLAISLSSVFGSVFGQRQNILQFVYTSDAHYGLSRSKFMGDTNVNAHVVNAVMIGKMNTLPFLYLPDDGGVNAGNKTGAIDYVVQTGDIANRMEIPYQSAAASWQQFEEDYLHKVKLVAHDGKPAQLLVAPGNHDISNVVGFYKPMRPLTDPSSMVGIYNLMLKPAVPKTNASYNYHTDKINYSKNVQGIHLIFITLWPDSAERIWMEKDLKTVSSRTPVIIFTHDQPACEAKHFTNPAPGHPINGTARFENLTEENYKEGDTAQGDDGKTDLEQRGWVKFLKAHPNIKAYFHGNSNWNEFYVYRGPDNNMALNTFRVDSPMKGKYSAKEETRLSFQLVSIDPKTQLMTVRECLWDTEPHNKNAPVKFGESKTVSLRVN